MPERHVMKADPTRPGTYVSSEPIPLGPNDRVTSTMDLDADEMVLEVYRDGEQAPPSASGWPLAPTFTLQAAVDHSQTHTITKSFS